MNVPEQNATVVASLSQSIARALGEAAPCHRLPSPGSKSLPEPNDGVQVVQLLMPMMPWDWPEATAGTIPYQQLVLADSVPVSAEPGAPYAASGASFSQGYANFLRLLAPERFPLPAVLDAAIAATVPPAGMPSSMTAPDGWVSVPDGAGINRWRMIYGTSTTPLRWVAEVASDPDNSVELTVPITAEKALIVTAPGGARSRLSLQGMAEQAVITAAALSQVSVTPGSWFSASMLQLGRDGAFVAGLAPTDRYAGMLSCRVGALIVAYNPVLRLVASDAGAGAAALSTAAKVEIGGFTFPAPVATLPAGTPGNRAPDGAPTYYARAAGAWIIGVSVDVLP